MFFITIFKISLLIKILIIKLVVIIFIDIPKITFRPNHTLTVKEGEETQLMCRTDGNDPDATTVWKIQPTNIIITQNDELNFKSINRTDAGIYTCRVDTKAGVYEGNATVVVQCKWCV